MTLKYDFWISKGEHKKTINDFKKLFEKYDFIELNFYFEFSEKSFSKKLRTVMIKSIKALNKLNKKHLINIIIN